MTDKPVTTKIAKIDADIVKGLNNLAAHLLKLDSGSGEARLLESAADCIEQLSGKIWELEHDR
ncbi:MAG: hypothetical protein WCD70_15055 [Alphaproteobacteria bacterium]